MTIIFAAALLLCVFRPLRQLVAGIVVFGFLGYVFLGDHKMEESTGATTISDQRAPAPAQSTTPYFNIKAECYTGLQPVISDSSKLRENIELCAKSETAFSEYLTQAWSHIPDDKKSYCRARG